jgi:hypothetical protein
MFIPLIETDVAKRRSRFHTIEGTEGRTEGSNRIKGEPSQPMPLSEPDPRLVSFNQDSF